MTFVHVPFLGDLSRLQFALIFGSIGLWLLVYVPLSIYHSSIYYKKRNNAIYRARYANITIYSAVFVVTKILFDCYDNTQYALITTSSPSLYISFLNIGNTLLVYLVIYSWIWRIWMISYEIIWTNCMMNDEWKRIINESYLAEERINDSMYTMNNKKTNWFLSNKTRFGNYKWVKWRLLIIVLLSFVINAFCDIYAALYLSDDTFYFYILQLIGLIPMILPYILLIIIYCITPKYEGDNFYILTEIKYIMFCLFIDYFIAYGAYTLFFALYNPKFNETDNIAFIATNISFHIGVLSQFLGLLISTMWVNKKVLKIVNCSRFKEVKINNNIFDDDQSMNGKLIKVHPAENRINGINGINNNIYFDKIKLKHVLRNELSLELFINHLYSEFCIECILSLIEFLQFQQYVAQSINYQKQINREKLLCEIIIFHESIPKSHIVFNQNNGNNLKKKAYQLYIKYINEDSAEYEINISFDVRKNITNLMQNIDKIDIKDIELMNIFNNCCKQMINLMKDSFSRFKASTPYQQIVSNIYNHTVNKH